MMRDPLAMARALIIMAGALAERTRRVAELEEKVNRLQHDNVVANSHIEVLENRLAEWDAAAGSVGPVGRPS